MHLECHFHIVGKVRMTLQDQGTGILTFFTNPDIYPVCCVTVVTEYLLCFKQLFQDGNHGMIFPSPKQEERFGDIPQCVLEKHMDVLSSYLNLASNLISY